MSYFSAGREAPTFFGWTPGLRRLICGGLLDCGCLIGVYQVKDAEFVTIIDHAAARCPVRGHSVNVILEAATSPAARTVIDSVATVRGGIHT